MFLVYKKVILIINFKIYVKNLVFLVYNKKNKKINKKIYFLLNKIFEYLSIFYCKKQNIYKFKNYLL